MKKINVILALIGVLAIIGFVYLSVLYPLSDFFINSVIFSIVFTSIFGGLFLFGLYNFEKEKVARKISLRSREVMMVLFTFLFIITFSESRSEEFKLNSFEVFSGKSSLFTGTDFILSFETDDYVLKVQGNEKRVYTRSLWKTPWSFESGLIGGYFENTFFLGPEFTFNPTTSYFSTFHQAGWYFFGKRGDPGLKKSGLSFIYNAVYFTINKITLSGVLFHFEGNKPDYLPGISLSQKINKNFTLITGGEYSYREAEPMYSISVRYIP